MVSNVINQYLTFVCCKVKSVMSGDLLILVIYFITVYGTGAKESSKNEHISFSNKAIPHTDMERPIGKALWKVWCDKWLSFGKNVSKGNVG